MKPGIAWRIAGGVLIAVTASAATVAALRIPWGQAWSAASGVAAALPHVATTSATGDQRSAEAPSTPLPARVGAAEPRTAAANEDPHPSPNSTAEGWSRDATTADDAASSDPAPAEASAATPIASSSTAAGSQNVGASALNEPADPSQVNYVELTENLADMATALERFNTKLRRTIAGSSPSADEVMDETARETPGEAAPSVAPSTSGAEEPSQPAQEQ